MGDIDDIDDIDALLAVVEQVESKQLPPSPNRQIADTGSGGGSATAATARTIAPPPPPASVPLSGWSSRRKAAAAAPISIYRTTASAPAVAAPPAPMLSTAPSIASVPSIVGRSVHQPPPAHAAGGSAANWTARNAASQAAGAAAPAPPRTQWTPSTASKGLPIADSGSSVALRVPLATISTANTVRNLAPPPPASTPYRPSPASSAAVSKPPPPTIRSGHTFEGSTDLKQTTLFGLPASTRPAPAPRAVPGPASSASSSASSSSSAARRPVAPPSVWGGGQMRMDQFATEETAPVLSPAELEAHCAEYNRQPIRHCPVDPTTAGTWQFPRNIKERQYQFTITRTALFHNTLVSLPTGLGKTFIASVVMLNFYRWYPTGKIVFLAPTRPLVMQQLHACESVSGIPNADCVTMIGTASPEKRIGWWQQKRVVFATPQTLCSDINRDSCPAKSIVCLVIDEAHRATGNHAYVKAVRDVMIQTNGQCRILALSATPGSSMEAVREVVKNLYISTLEARMEDDSDVKPYVHGRTVEKIVVPQSAGMDAILAHYCKVVRVPLARLNQFKLYWENDPEKIQAFAIKKAADALRANPPAGIRQDQLWPLSNDCYLVHTLATGMSLLKEQGLEQFRDHINQNILCLGGEKKITKSKAMLSQMHEFGEMMDLLEKAITSGEGHPKVIKLEEILIAHFNKIKNAPLTPSPLPKRKSGTAAAAGGAARVMTSPQRIRSAAAGGDDDDDDDAVDTTLKPGKGRVIIFTRFRDSVSAIVRQLNRHAPDLRATEFIGQAAKTSTTAAGGKRKGQTQKIQQEIIRKFKAGEFNILVATCIGEEGLDIGEVDLIIAYDSTGSPISLVQRMGRTGRKRAGQCISLMVAGNEEKAYENGQKKSEALHKSLRGSRANLPFYKENARMLPDAIVPRVDRCDIAIDATAVKSRTPKRSSRKPSDDDSGDAATAYLTEAELAVYDQLLPDASEPTMPHDLSEVMRRHSELQSYPAPVHRIGHSTTSRLFTATVNSIREYADVKQVDDRTVGDAFDDGASAFDEPSTPTPPPDESINAAPEPDTERTTKRKRARAASRVESVLSQDSTAATAASDPEEVERQRWKKRRNNTASTVAPLTAGDLDASGHASAHVSADPTASVVDLTDDLVEPAKPARPLFSPPAEVSKSEIEPVVASGVEVLPNPVADTKRAAPLPLPPQPVQSASLPLIRLSDAKRKLDAESKTAPEPKAKPKKKVVAAAAAPIASSSHGAPSLMQFFKSSVAVPVTTIVRSITDVESERRVPALSLIHSLPAPCTVHAMLALPQVQWDVLFPNPGSILRSIYAEELQNLRSDPHVPDAERNAAAARIDAKVAACVRMDDVPHLAMEKQAPAPAPAVPSIAKTTAANRDARPVPGPVQPKPKSVAKDQAAIAREQARTAEMEARQSERAAAENRGFNKSWNAMIANSAIIPSPAVGATVSAATAISTGTAASAPKDEASIARERKMLEIRAARDKQELDAERVKREQFEAEQRERDDCRKWCEETKRAKAEASAKTEADRRRADDAKRVANEKLIQSAQLDKAHTQTLDAQRLAERNAEFARRQQIEQRRREALERRKQHESMTAAAAAAAATALPQAVVISSTVAAKPVTSEYDPSSDPSLLAEQRALGSHDQSLQSATALLRPPPQPPIPTAPLPRIAPRPPPATIVARPFPTGKPPPPSAGATLASRPAALSRWQTQRQPPKPAPVASGIPPPPTVPVLAADEYGWQLSTANLSMYGPTQPAKAPASARSAVASAPAANLVSTKHSKRLSFSPHKGQLLSPEAVADAKANEETVCDVCRSGQSEDLLLLCDSCDLGFHTFCLDPPLDAVPAGAFYCPQCLDDQEHKQPQSDAALSTPAPLPTGKKRRRLRRVEDASPSTPAAAAAPTTSGDAAAMEDTYPVPDDRDRELDVEIVSEMNADDVGEEQSAGEASPDDEDAEAAADDGSDDFESSSSHRRRKRLPPIPTGGDKNEALVARKARSRFVDYEADLDDEDGHGASSDEEENDDGADLVGFIDDSTPEGDKTSKRERRRRRKAKRKAKESGAIPADAASSSPVDARTKYLQEIAMSQEIVLPARWQPRPDSPIAYESQDDPLRHVDGDYDGDDADKERANAAVEAHRSDRKRRDDNDGGDDDDDDDGAGANASKKLRPRSLRFDRSAAAAPANRQFVPPRSDRAPTAWASLGAAVARVPAIRALPPTSIPADTLAVAADFVDPSFLAELDAVEHQSTKPAHSSSSSSSASSSLAAPVAAPRRPAARAATTTAAIPGAATRVVASVAALPIVVSNPKHDFQELLAGLNADDLSDDFEPTTKPASSFSSSAAAAAPSAVPAAGSELTFAPSSGSRTLKSFLSRQTAGATVRTTQQSTLSFGEPSAGGAAPAVDRPLTIEELSLHYKPESSTDLSASTGGGTIGQPLLEIVMDTLQTNRGSISSLLRNRHNLRTRVLPISTRDRNAKGHFIVGHSAVVLWLSSTELPQSAVAARLSVQLCALTPLFDRVYVIVQNSHTDTPQFLAKMGPDRKLEKAILDLCAATKHVTALHTADEHATAFVLRELAATEASDAGGGGGPVAIPPHLLSALLSKSMSQTKSALEFLQSVPCISVICAINLMIRFNDSVSAICNASADALALVPGVSRERAERIFTYFRHQFNPI